MKRAAWLLLLLVSLGCQGSPPPPPAARAVEAAAAPTLSLRSKPVQPSARPPNVGQVRQEPSGLLFYEDFSSFDSDRPVASWMALRGSEPVRYTTSALARTLRPGGGVTMPEPGILAVTFPKAGGCSGAPANDGHPACNGALVTMFDPPLTEPDLWVTIRSKEGDLPAGWAIGYAYKFLRTTWASDQIGVGVDIRPGLCGRERERYFLLAGARTGDSLCAQPAQYDGVWATWELHIGPNVSEVYRNGERLLSIPTGSAGRGGLRYIEWGANMNIGVPAQQTRYFDFFAVSTRRLDAR